MKLLSIVVLGNQMDIKVPENVEVLFYGDGNFKEFIEKEVNSKYVIFFNSNDELVENYLDIILNYCSQVDFDSCLLNYKLNYDYNEDIKELTDLYEYPAKPYKYSYIWSFIFNKYKLIEALNISDEEDFNARIDEIFNSTAYINDVLIYHNPKRSSNLFGEAYVDVKQTKYFKNIIYMGNFCNGQFNGYISWLNNLGRIFSSKYPITILYDNLVPEVKEKFEKYFRVEKFSEKYNFVCDRLLVTYSTYYYPRNVICLDENYMFIHGNTADYPDARTFKDDIYTKYFGVSKISADKSIAYYPTDEMDYIINPIKIDYELVKPHLKLVTAQRNDPVKRADRIELIANILDEEGIPYTWNLFMDMPEYTTSSGLIHRQPVVNPLPYVNDADYYVQLSDSEAYCYSVVEALSLNTKVIITPLECYDELDIVDGENATIIPFDYFEPENKELLREVVRKIYAEKEKEINYHFNEKLYDKYNELFLK